MGQLVLDLLGMGPLEPVAAREQEGLHVVARPLPLGHHPALLSLAQEAHPLERRLHVEGLVAQHVAQPRGDLGLAQVLAVADLEQQIVQRQPLVHRPAQKQAPEQLAPAPRRVHARELVVRVVAERVDGVVLVADAVLRRQRLEDQGVAALVGGLAGHLDVEGERHVRVLVEVAAAQLHGGVLAVHLVVHGQADAGAIDPAVERDHAHRPRRRPPVARLADRARYATLRSPQRLGRDQALPAVAAVPQRQQRRHQRVGSAQAQGGQGGPGPGDLGVQHRQLRGQDLQGGRVAHRIERGQELAIKRAQVRLHQVMEAGQHLARRAARVDGLHERAVARADGGLAVAAAGQAPQQLLDALGLRQVVVGLTGQLDLDGQRGDLHVPARHHVGAGPVKVGERGERVTGAIEAVGCGVGGHASSCPRFLGSVVGRNRKERRAGRDQPCPPHTTRRSPPPTYSSRNHPPSSRAGRG